MTTHEDEKKAAEAANVAKYGCAACSCCGHQFDDWKTEAENGGRKRRAVIKHPHERKIDDKMWDRNPVYRILPCASCPEQFKDEFWTRQGHDEEVAIMIKFM
jgi:hypothetical protein